MGLKIRRAAVLGSGVMGAQIGAHLAAAGVRVHILDLASDAPPTDPKQKAAVGKNFRSARSILSIENLKSLKPSPLATESVLQNLIPGNFEDDWDVLRNCDWIIEAVVERLDIKKQILKKLEDVAPYHIPVTTNTSGVSLTKMVEDMPEHFQKRFFGTHFFNPPRYMYLVEMVSQPHVDKKLFGELSTWIETYLGKGIVNTQDTVNFIANRVGVFSIQASLKHMADLKLSIETVDALTGKLMGRPASATLRTMDVVGLDTYAHVARNVYDSAPTDPFRDIFQPPAWLKELIDKGAFGQKSGSVGCYKKDKNAKGETVILAYRPETKSYATQEPQMFPWMETAAREPNLYKRLAGIIAQKDAGAEYIWRVLRDTFAYSAILLTEIAAGEPETLDHAIQWGFNWESGPFELWQALGFETIFARMKAELPTIKWPTWLKDGVTFYTPSPTDPAWERTGATAQFNSKAGKMAALAPAPHMLRLPKRERKDDPRVVLSNKSASLLDIGDKVGCLVFHSKMNAIDDGTIEMLQKSVEYTAKNWDALVLGNEGEHFSAGANLKRVTELIEAQDWKGIDGMLRGFQGAMQMIKYAPFPTVACPHGLTLGGGCEITLHASHRLAALETYAGLVEVGVGLIPGGGGTKELALRAYDMIALGERGDAMTFLQRAFLLIGMAKTSTSGFEIAEMGLYPQTSSVAISRAHQIVRAKSLALNMVERCYAPPTPKTAIKVVGDPGIQTFKLMLYNMVEGRQVSAYDAFVGEKVATVLCGGEVDGGATVSEQYFLELERRVFVELCHEKKTQDRIVAMLKTGKPLRN